MIPRPPNGGATSSRTARLPILKLETSVDTKLYTVRADIGGLEGDWKGFAVIQSINGKLNPVPDVDLFLSFYEDRKVPFYVKSIDGAPASGTSVTVDGLSLAARGRTMRVDLAIENP